MMMKSKQDKIGVIDYGGQYAHLIANVVRSIGVYSDILQPHQLRDISQYRGIILSGSPALSSGDELSVNPLIFKLNIPVLGFCFGHQEIAKFHGGRVEHKGQEFGRSLLKLVKKSPIFLNLPDEQVVWMSHGDAVTDPGDMEEIAVSLDPDNNTQKYSAISDEKLRHYGFQFHPEVDDTEYGREMIENYVIGICGCRKSWNSDYMVEDIENSIKTEVKTNQVVMLVSGGVDSTVAAVLLHRALPASQLHFIHVDTGLMRYKESEQVTELFESEGMLPSLVVVDASEQFLRELQGVYDPEQKRNIIGKNFIDLVNDEVAKFDLSTALLAQGTIYPDRIETGETEHAHRIKTHHNRIPQIEAMIRQGLVIEPLKDLYKFEVRKVGQTLGIPQTMLQRHPFPGPGLGIRCICSQPDNLDYKQITVLRAKLKDNCGKYYSEVLPVKSVGVKADQRSYEYPGLLWKENYCGEEIDDIAAKIFRNVDNINRIIWLGGNHANPPVSIQPVLADINAARLEKLRAADNLAQQLLVEQNLYDEIWQMPVISLPLKINQVYEDFIILRPVISKRGMTARPYYLPPLYLKTLSNRFKQVGVNWWGVDVSTKPPATIEWE
ncbi:MAG: glutamine-hydrolyzing GMP synthase [bacterium]